MAHVRFDLTKALNRESYAYNCWVNKNYENNTLAITDDEIRQIEERWGNERVRDWKFEAENDHTEYEIDDEDFDLAALESQEDTKAEVEEVTGEGSATYKQKGNNAGNYTAAGINAGAAVGTTVANVAATTAATAAQTAATTAQLASITANGASMAAQTAVSTHGIFSSQAALASSAASSAQATASSAQASAQAASAAADKAANVGKALCYVGCAVSLAIGVLYEATRPNKKPHEALMQLKELMKTSTDNLVQEQLAMEDIGNEAEEKASNSEQEQDQKQKEINVKAQVLMFATLIQMDIQNKMNAGEPITASEKTMFDNAAGQISTLAGEVQTLSADLANTSEVNASEISLLTGEFDQKALNIANALGQAEFAATFDQATRNLCIVQAASQALNVVSGGVNGALAIGTGPWGWVFAAMGFAGAGMSVHGVIEQSKFAINIKEEIDVRENLQSMVGKSLESYSLNISKQVVAQQVAESTNTLENTERFGEALTTSESINVQVTPENPESGNNPFGFKISEGEEDANPFNKKLVI